MKEIFASKGTRLKGKLIVLAVTGSVACIKSFELCRELIRHGAKVQVVMSKAALKMVGEQLMAFASGNKVITGLTGHAEHVKFFGKNGKADLLLIAPATANTISKIAMGIDDTPVTTFATTAIGSGKTVLIAPAMHQPMYEHPIVKENLAKLESMRRIKIIWPLLEEQKAKISSIESILLEVEAAFSKKILSGKKVLVIAGATQEQIDSVRFITTSASGKTGKEIAKETFRNGAKTTILHNELSFFPQIKSINYSTAEELYRLSVAELLLLLLQDACGFDFFFCPAAIGDFEVKKSRSKLDSRSKAILELNPRKEKLIEIIRKKNPGLFVVAFKAETGISKKTLEKKCREFMEKTGVQMVVGNLVESGGFGTDHNEVILVARNKKTIFFKGKKELLAQKIVVQAAENRRNA